MGVGRGAGEGLGSPWIAKLLFVFHTLKKGCFFEISRGENQISALLAPRGKNVGKILYCPPLEKILPTPVLRALYLVMIWLSCA